jgi:hypothetical protein
MSSLGTVIEEKQTKDAQLFQQPMPGNDSNQTFVIDIFGAIRTISIRGKYVGANIGAVQTFISQLTGLINGIQVVRVYVSDLFVSGINVYVMMVDYTYEAGNPLSVDYSIQLIETATL